jgi:hypothetical protein
MLKLRRTEGCENLKVRKIAESIGIEKEQNAFLKAGEQ